MYDIQNLKPDFCIINDLGSFAGEGQAERLSLPGTGAALNMRIVLDQVVPPNDPAVSAGQRGLMELSKKCGIPFTYGKGMTAALLQEEAGSGKKPSFELKAGSVVLGSNPELSRLGGLGVLGICLPEEKLVSVLRGEEWNSSGTEVRRVVLTGTLKEGVGLKDAAFCALKALGTQSPETLLLVSGADGFSVEEKMNLCGILAKSGALSAVVDEGCAADTEWEVMTYDLGSAEPVLVKSGGFEEIVPVKKLPERTVRVVYIGGEYGGSLEDIRKTAELVKGKKIADQLRLLVSPATSETYAKAADLGYLTEIMDAGGMILNQCASAPVQGRIGVDELMVSNNIHNRSGYAGPDSSEICLASTETAVQSALSGKVGGAE